LAAGRHDAARPPAQAVPIPDQPEITELDVTRAAVLAEVSLRTDDRNLLQQMLIHARAAYANGSFTERRAAAHALAMAAWYRGDIEEAARWSDVELLGPPLTPQGLDQVILRARVAAASGDSACRASVLRAIDRLSRDELPLFTAVVLQARGLLDADVEVLVRAADLFASSPRPLLYGAAAEDAGAQLIQAGRSAEAVEHLNAAFDTYGRVGAVTDARRVARRLRQLGVERRMVRQTKVKTGWDSLTDSELKVVTLVAQGATNRAIADQLHLALGTVKTHVHNAFGKLAISSRAQLVPPGR
jgi:DNA-binding CsgD family transcriptional regulator